MPKVPTQPYPPQRRLAWLQPILVGGSALIIAIFVFWPPITLLDKAQAIGYAICHQIPARTLHIDDYPLPLWLAGTGIYLGALMGLAGLLLKRRYAIDLPPTAILVTLVAFILIMGFDGVTLPQFLSQSAAPV